MVPCTYIYISTSCRTASKKSGTSIFVRLVQSFVNILRQIAVTFRVPYKHRTGPAVFCTGCSAKGRIHFHKVRLPKCRIFSKMKPRSPRKFNSEPLTSSLILPCTWLDNGRRFVRRYTPLSKGRNRPFDSWIYTCDVVRCWATLLVSNMTFTLASFHRRRLVISLPVVS